MSNGNLSYDELMQIVQFVESSTHFAEFHLKVGDIEIELRKRSADGAGVAADAKSQPGAVATAAPAPGQGGLDGDAQG
jgi:acetyl-CoA carboxylase biotin carboxyl carrier protein